MALQTLKEYDHLLAEATRLRRQHEVRAKDYVPKMYRILVETSSPQEATDRIYKDLAGIWEKDTIRRLLPVEAKNQPARTRQALSRSNMTNKAELLVRPEDREAPMTLIEREYFALVKKLEVLQNEKRALLEKTLRLERMLTVQRELHDPVRSGHTPGDKRSAVVMQPNLFMKAFTLMRNSTKPLVLKIAADEVVDVEKLSA